MEKLYKVTFTYLGERYVGKVVADSEYDAIARSMDLGVGENWDAVLIAIDGVPVND